MARSDPQAQSRNRSLDSGLLERLLATLEKEMPLPARAPVSGLRNAMLVALSAALLAGCKPSAPAATAQDGWNARLAAASSGHGAALFVQTMTHGSEQFNCATCHGAKGQGNYGDENPAHVAPRLAGLNAAYVGEQLAAYRSGGRVFPPMQAMAGRLDDQGIADLAVYVHGLQAPAAEVRAQDAALLARGQATFLRGADGVDACSHCHGVAGTGKIKQSPPIAGQPASYLVRQLEQMGGKRGRSSGAPAQVMNAVAHNLAQADRQAVAAYIQGLAPANSPMAPATGARP